MANQGPPPVRQGRVAHQVMGKRAKPMPVIVFHGNADSTVNVLNADQVVEQWITTNNLAFDGKVEGWIDHKPKEVREEKGSLEEILLMLNMQAPKEKFQSINTL